VLLRALRTGSLGRCGGEAHPAAAAADAGA
jgi:hypothetical protein